MADRRQKQHGKADGRQGRTERLRPEICGAERRRSLRRGLVTRGYAFAENALRRDADGAHKQGHDRFLAEVPSDDGEGQRNNKERNGGDTHPPRLLRRVAERVGGFPHGEGEVYADGDAEAHGGIFGLGEPNTAYAKYFIGNSYLAPVSREQVAISNVTFEPRCRNNWHIHRATKGGGQMLIGVAGRGWYQEEGKAPVEILPGTVIHIPANVKHWHGAAADSWFAHLAFEVPGEKTSNEWLEPVTDEEYDQLEQTK